MTSCIVPTSLVMRACKCFYCSNDDTGFVSVYPDDHLFGILYCDTHKADALRDCCAYLHVNQQVLLEDAHRNSQLRDIVVFLMSNSVHIRRTNGISEPGWKLNQNGLIRCLNDSWTIPMVWNNHITKNVPLLSFLEADIRALNTNVPASFYDSLSHIIECLSKGLYLQEYSEQQYILVQAKGSFKAVPETTGVTSVLTSQGIVRVLY